MAKQKYDFDCFVDAQKIKEAASFVSGYTATRSPIEILKKIKICFGGGEIVMQADNSVNSFVSYCVKDEGANKNFSFVIDPSKLITVIAGFVGNARVMYHSESGKACIKTDDGEFTFLTEDESKFPAQLSPEGDFDFSCDKGELVQAIAFAQHGAGKVGIFAIETHLPNSGLVSIFGSDNVRYACAKIEVKAPVELAGNPAYMAMDPSHLKSALRSSGNEEIVFCWTGNRSCAFFKCGDFVIGVRLQHGLERDYSTLIARARSAITTTFVVDKWNMKSALDRVSVTNGKESQACDICALVGSGSVVFKSQSWDGDASVTMNAESLSGEGGDVTVNSNYALQMLSSSPHDKALCPSSKVTVGFSAIGSPVVFDFGERVFGCLSPMNPTQATEGETEEG